MFTTVSLLLLSQDSADRFALKKVIATDTDVPQEFSKGAAQGYIPAAGRPNRNAAVHTKPAEETMRERAHVGSAAWVEAPNTLQRVCFCWFRRLWHKRY